MSEINELAHSTGEREEYIDTFESSNSLEQAKAEEYYEAYEILLKGLKQKHLPQTKKLRTWPQEKHQGPQV